MKPAFALLLGLWLSIGPAAAETAGARDIPLQLIVGDHWDGPKQWTHPKTGRTLEVYFRNRGGRNAADQVLAVRDDRTAIGRVADSRFGITACDQEAKYPLGLWKQGETRSFDSTCWYGDKPRAKVTTITIQEINFTHEGAEHCLQHEWTLRDKYAAKPTDHRIYVFCPNRGTVHQRKVQ